MKMEPVAHIDIVGRESKKRAWEQDTESDRAKSPSMNSQRKYRRTHVRLPVNDSRSPRRAEYSRGHSGGGGGDGTGGAGGAGSGVGGPSEKESDMSWQISKSANTRNCDQPNNPRPLHKNGELFIELPRSVFPRGTRGKNDPRNAAMKAARDSYVQQRLREQKRQEYQIQRLVGENRAKRHAATATKTHLPPADRATFRPTVSLPSNTDPYTPTASTSIVAMTDVLQQLQKPLPSTQTHHSATSHRNEDNWRSWAEVRLVVFGLTPSATTHNLWTSLKKEGNITDIDIRSDRKSPGSRHAMVTFR